MKRIATVGIRDLRQHLHFHVQRAANGQEVDITQHGAVVARLGPVPVSGSPLQRLVDAGKATLPRGELLTIRPLRSTARRLSVSEKPCNANAGKCLASESLLYLDSSALVKLVLAEPETNALRSFLRAWPMRITSALARVDVIRAVRRVSLAPATVLRAEQLVAAVALLSLDDLILRQAARLSPEGLRSLDAIHLASALSVQSDLGAMVVYDVCLAQAAKAFGVATVQPGRSRPSL